MKPVFKLKFLNQNSQTHYTIIHLNRKPHTPFQLNSQKHPSLRWHFQPHHSTLPSVSVKITEDLCLSPPLRSSLGRSHKEMQRRAPLNRVARVGMLQSPAKARNGDTIVKSHSYICFNSTYVSCVCMCFCVFMGPYIWAWMLRILSRSIYTKL